MAKGKMPSNTEYQITIGGLYFGTKDGETQTFPYEVTVLMDQQLIDAGALSVFKRHIAQDVMPKSYPNFISLYTHEIRKCESDRGEGYTGLGGNVSLMNRDDLIAYIADNDLAVKQELYEDDNALQQAVIDCEADEEAFLNAQKQLNEKRAPAVALRNKARALNSSTKSKPAPSASVPASAGKQVLKNL